MYIYILPCKLVKYPQMRNAFLPIAEYSCKPLHLFWLSFSSSSSSLSSPSSSSLQNLLVKRTRVIHYFPPSLLIRNSRMTCLDSSGSLPLLSCNQTLAATHLKTLRDWRTHFQCTHSCGRMLMLASLSYTCLPQCSFSVFATWQLASLRARKHRDPCLYDLSLNVTPLFSYCTILVT